VYCLGAFRVYQGDRLITDWNGLKGKSILKYLLAHRETPVARDILMELFWPGADPESARRSLHQAIYSLRQALRRGNPDFAHVYFENDCYLLNPGMSIWVDSVEFEKHFQAGRRLEATDRITKAIAEYGIAESLYQGEYLEEDLYEDWPAAERERLRRTYCDLGDRLSEHYVRNGEHNAAIALCHKILARDNCHEPAHRRLMRCYLAQGQRHLAVRQYQTCVELLQVELELGPSEETEALYQDITNAR
jgi:DNA-binding SARP family transcriptional activator